jgi:hypothetical protein
MHLRALRVLGGIALAAALTGGLAYAHAAVKAPRLMEAKAVLKPVPPSHAHGTAVLVLNPATHVLKVTVTVAGLAPGTKHPMHIHAGMCPHFGKIVYWLRYLTANRSGVGHSVTLIDGVKAIPAKGWLVNIHQGPGLTGKQLTQLACGDVVGGHGAASSGAQGGSGGW